MKSMWEIYDLVQRADQITKLEGYYCLYFYYPGMILFNAYKQNDIFLDLVFIATLKDK